MTPVIALVTAAGRSRRMGAAGNKLLLTARGRPLLAWTLEVFARSPRVARIYVTASKEDVTAYRALIADEGIPMVAAVLAGGAERQESVFLALRRIQETDPDAVRDPLIAVHDGARPLLSDEALERVLREAEACGGALLGVPVKETVKRVAADGSVVETVPRESLIAAQTPQVFPLKRLLAAHLQARDEGFAATDDAMLMERLGDAVRVVTGDYDNIKVTTPEDMIALEGFLQRRAAVS